MWFKWTSRTAFDSWHETVIAGLHLPRVGVNQRTGNPEPDKQQTTAYTSVERVGLRDWRAPVEEDVAAEFADGLGVPSNPPPSPI